MAIFVTVGLALGLAGTRAHAMLPEVPRAKRVVRAMDYIISNHIDLWDWDKWAPLMEGYFTEDFIYDTVPPIANGDEPYIGLRAWFLGEHIKFNRIFGPVQFNQVIFAADDLTATTTTYANAYWRGHLGEVPAQNTTVRVRICDFYTMVADDQVPEGAQIKRNWMMLDIVGMLKQVGLDPLPTPVLADGELLLPPRAMDGLPAPNDMIATPEDAAAARAVAMEAFAQEWAEQGGPSEFWADDMIWYGPAGIGTAYGVHQYKKGFLDLMYAAFTNVHLEIDVVPCQGKYCGAHGYLWGDHTGTWLGAAPTGKRIKLRFGCHWRVEDGKITEGYTMMDLVALFRDYMGRDLLAGPPLLAPEAFDSVEPKSRRWILWLIMGSIIVTLAAVLHWVERRKPEDGPGIALTEWPDVRQAFRWSQERLNSMSELNGLNDPSHTPLLEQQATTTPYQAA